MKYLTTIIALVVLEVSMVFAQEASPQKYPIGVGIKFAIGYAALYGFDETDDDVDGDPYGMTYEVGTSLKIKLAEKIDFSPEINLAYATTSHEYLYSTRTYSRLDFEIPLLLRSTLLNRYYIALGPQFNINLSQNTDFKIENSEFSEKIEQASFDVGIAMGLGVRIIDKLFFDFRVYLGLTEIFPDVAYAFDENSFVDFVSSDNWSLINMAGAKALKIKGGFSYWFL